VAAQGDGNRMATWIRSGTGVVPEVDRSDEETESIAGFLWQVEKLHPHADVCLHPNDVCIALDGLAGRVVRQGEAKLDSGTNRWWVLGVDKATRLAEVLDAGLNGRRIGRVGRLEGSLNPNRGTLALLIRGSHDLPHITFHNTCDCPW